MVSFMGSTGVFLVGEGERVDKISIGSAEGISLEGGGSG